MINALVASLIAVVVDDLFRIFYGTKWAEAILPIYILCISGFVRSIGAGSRNMLLALGLPNVNLRILFYQMIGIMVLLYPTILFGDVPGVCILILISVIYSECAAFRALRPILQYTYRDIAGVILPFVCWVLIGTGICLAIRAFIFVQPQLIEVVALGGLLLLLYVIQLIWFDTEARGIFKKLIYERRLSL